MIIKTEYKIPILKYPLAIKGIETLETGIWMYELSRFKTENRQDDTEDVIKTRIFRYLSETKPLSDFFKTKYPSDYLVINGNQEIEKVTADIIKILKK